MQAHVASKRSVSIAPWAVAIGAVLALVAEIAWTPLGLIVALVTLGIVIRQPERRPWVVVASVVLVALTVAMTTGYSVGLVSSGPGHHGPVPLPHRP